MINLVKLLKKQNDTCFPLIITTKISKTKQNTFSLKQNLTFNPTKTNKIKKKKTEKTQTIDKRKNSKNIKTKLT